MGKGRDFSDLCGEKKKTYLYGGKYKTFRAGNSDSPEKTIRGIISKCNSDKFCKGFDTWSQLVSMIFCQFANSTSVRDISNGLKSATGNLNHLGIREAPSKPTVAYQNRHRSSNVFKEIYYACLEHLGQHTFGKRKKFRFKSPIKLLDSTLISVCLSVFDWAHYKTHKGAVKMHAMLDFDMLLPHYVLITDGKKGDNTAAKQIPVERGTVVVSDRYYCDFELLNLWDSNGVFFVVRHKRNLAFRKVRENDLPPVRHQNVLIDEIVELTGPQTRGKYPKQLRRVVVYNEEKDFTVELLTNNFNWTASTIGELYKSRWQIEIFFRHVKELLHIKSFVGTSQNAVEIQLWTALITILMLKYLQFKASYDWCLSNLTASLRLNTFTKMDLWKWLDEPFTPPPDTPGNPNEGVQLSFF